MKNLSKKLLANNLSDMSMMDETEIPLFLIKNLKQDLENLFRRYVDFKEDNLKIKIKILSNNKYVIMVDCLADFMMTKYNI